MLATKKEEDAAIWDDYLEQRKEARLKEEEEIKKLKERQARRKAQRQEHEKIMQEMRRKQEEARQRELEEKRIKEEETKRKRMEEAEMKRQQMQEAMKKQREAAKRSFAINKKSDGSGPVMAADLANVASVDRSVVIKTKEQLAEEKKIAMQFRVKPLQLDGLALEELKKKASELWEQIVQAESDRYDLEERQKRQEYDLKELSERQRQINRNKALKKGLDPEALSGKHPPKLQVASKYERRLDRRDFGDKKHLFEGGYDKLTKEEQDKLWEERINSFKESHGDKKVNKWDPSTLRQTRQDDDPDRAIYDGDDDDDLDMIDAYKAFIQKDAEQGAGEDRRRSSAASAGQRRVSAPKQPEPEEEEEEEEEEVEEEEEYEEEEDEEEEE